MQRSSVFEQSKKTAAHITYLFPKNCLKPRIPKEALIAVNRAYIYQSGAFWSWVKPCSTTPSMPGMKQRIIGIDRTMTKYSSFQLDPLFWAIIRSQSATEVSLDSIILAFASASVSFNFASAACLSAFPCNHVEARFPIGPNNACYIIFFP